MRRARHAFSLLELMLVVLIIGILGGVAAIALIPQAEKARHGTTIASMDVINGAIKGYMLQEGAPPPSIQSLVPQYLEAGKTKDAWKREFVYRTPGLNGRDYELRSLGKDVNDKSDDIDVWTMHTE